MNSLTFVAKILLNIIEADLIKFPLGDLNRLHCLLALLEVPQLDKGGNRMPGVSPPYDIREFDLLMKDVKVDLSCSDCSSLAVTQLTAVAAPVLSSIFKAGVDVRVGGNGPEANGIVPTLERYLYSQRDEIRHEIDLFLSNTRQQCISHPDYDPDAFSPLKDAIRITGVGTVSRELPDDDRPGHILAACCALAAIAVAVGLVTNLTLRRIVARRQRRWLQSLSADQVVGILHQQKQKEAHQAKLNSLCSSVMCSTYVPTPIRICIPLALLVTFGLFLGGFLGAASEISVSAYFNGVDAISFSAGYSMASLVNETWQAGGEFLAVSSVHFFS